jgi:hypothetical protein
MAILSSNAPNEAITAIADMCTELLAFNIDYLPALRHHGVITDLMDYLWVSINVCNSSLTHSLLTLVAVVLRRAPNPVGCKLACSLPYRAYDSVIRANAPEDSVVALGIVTDMVLWDVRECREFFERVNAVEAYYEGLVDKGPYAALAAWTRFCYAMMKKGSESVFCALTRTFAAWARCAETEETEVVGYFLATVLLMIEAGVAVGQEELIAEMLAEREIRERIEAIAEAGGEDEFIPDDPLARERAPSSLGVMAALVLAFLESRGV